MSQNTIPKVLILGGGYVTITAARGLRKAIQNKEVEVTVVSRENFHCFHGFVGEMLTGRVSVGSIVSPVRRIAAPAQIHIANVEHIDLTSQKVTVSKLHDGSKYDLSYDHLIIALGSASNQDMYPGLKEHAFCLKTYDGCVKLKNHILQMFERASATDDAEERRALLTFVVAGGGYAGTEIAGEISDFVRILTSKEYKHIDREECEVILACKTETILPELFKGKGASGYGNGHPSLVKFASHHAEKLGVNVMLNKRVRAASSSYVYLSDGSKIATRTIINAVGTKPQPVVEALGFETDVKGRIILNPDMTVKGYNNVWSAGDCAALPHPKGDYCPSVGIFALKGGQHIAKNLKRKISNKPLKPFSYIGLGQGVSIGKRTAVVELKGLRIKGFLAWMLWRILLVYYFPTWDRRIRLIADWIMWLFVGRDIVEMGMKDSNELGIKKHIFQQGEKIANAGSKVDYKHLITKGEVKIIYNNLLLETLKHGDYIDLESYEDFHEVTAYAKGVVRTVAIKESQVGTFERLFTTKVDTANIVMQ